jgi:MFS family permease
MLNRFRQHLVSLGPAFASLLVSDALMLLAMMVGQVALPWWIAEQGGAHDLALYGVVTSALAVLAMPALSPLGDRLSKRRVLMLGLGLFLIAALLLLALAGLGHYHLGVVLVIGLLAVLANAMVMPATLAIVPDMVPAAKIPAALGLQKSAQAIGRMVGPALGGMVLAAAGMVAAFASYAALLLVALLAASRIRLSASARPASTRSWSHDLRAGLSAKWRVPLDRYWTLSGALMMVFFLPALGMMVPLRVRSLGLSAAWLGACEAALSAGMLLGAAWLAAWAGQRLGRLRAMFAALVLSGVGLLAIGLVRQPVVLMLLFAVTGACLVTTQLVGQTHRLLAVPDAFRARISAVNIMTSQIAGSLGPALAGVLLTHLDTGQVYGVLGGGFLAGTLALRAVPGLGDFLALDHDAAKGWFARQHPAAYGKEAEC